jgi:23S rRNA pseudoU1915 N3-methylase RlmH
MTKTKTGLPPSVGNKIDQNKIKTAQKAETLHLRQEIERSQLETKLSKRGLLRNSEEFLAEIRQQENAQREDMARTRRGGG